MTPAILKIHSKRIGTIFLIIIFILSICLFIAGCVLNNKEFVIFGILIFILLFIYFIRINLFGFAYYLQDINKWIKSIKDYLCDDLDLWCPDKCPYTDYMFDKEEIF